MFQSTRAEIHLPSLHHNWSMLKKHQQGRFLCPVVKAKAYGHDDILVSKKLEQWGCENFGVCLIEEGVRLREAGIQKPILVFRAFNEEGLEACLENKLTPAISGWDQIEILKKYRSKIKSPFSVHIKFDTGMKRLGFQTEEAEKISEFFKSEKIYQVDGVMTHLACSEDALQSDGWTAHQLKSIDQASKYFQNPQLIVHALNSGGIIAQMQSLKESSSTNPWIKKGWGARPGIMLYGYNPVPYQASESLKPVMKLVSSPMALRKVKKGEGVSYSHTWVAPKDSVIAVIPIGYADGYPRQLSGLAEVSYDGKLVSQVGRVCMDYIMLDVTSVEKNPERQDFNKIEVVLWGSDLLPVEKVAEKLGTIPYELVTRVSDRVPKIAVGEVSGGLQ